MIEDPKTALRREKAQSALARQREKRAVEYVKTRYVSDALTVEAKPKTSRPADGTGTWVATWVYVADSETGLETAASSI